MPPEIKTFRDLIAWLVREHHKGVWYDMAKKLQVSSGLVYQWRDGTVKSPSEENLEALCKAYRLDYWKVWGIIKGRKPPSAAMWIAGAALGLTLLATAPASASPLPAASADSDLYQTAPYRKYRRRRSSSYWWWSAQPLGGLTAA